MKTGEGVVREGRDAGGVHHKEDESFWRNIWQLKCSNEMKHFVWRMSHNSLALRMTLQRRGQV